MPVLEDVCVVANADVTDDESRGDIIVDDGSAVEEGG